MKEEMRLVIGGTVFILLFAFVSNMVIGSSQEELSENFSGSWACTTDVQICPDGSTVGRTPPYCMFAACPN